MRRIWSGSRSANRSSRDGPAARLARRAIPAADLTATTLTALWRSELLVSYSSFFWNMQKRVGQEDLPVDLTRAEADEPHDTLIDLVDITSRLGLH